MDQRVAPGVVGRAIPRSHARRLVAGRGAYADDLRFPRLLHAAFLRSPHARARIARLDFSAASRSDGVFAIYEPHQAEETIAYLIVGTKQALLFDTGMGIGNIRNVVSRLLMRHGTDWQREQFLGPISRGTPS